MTVRPDNPTLILDRLTKLHPKLIDLGLERTIQLSNKCGAPHLHLPPVIHIAGTNGKGSVSAFLRSMAEAAGLSCHVYNSPHLCRFNERIRLNGKFICDDELIDVLSEVERVNGSEPITFFESTTVAAFLAFSRHPADILILETGLGGVFDSTNIVPNSTCTIITPIAFDHEQFLGSDIASIARQKAGIMRPGRPSIWAKQQPQAYEQLQQQAKQLCVSVQTEGKDFQVTATDTGGLSLKAGSDTITTPSLSLYGDHQTQNAALALMALKTSGLITDVAAAAEGAGQANWPARVEKLKDGHLTRLAGRTVWLDGAHNVHGAKALVASLSSLYPHKWTVIFGALNTRPADEFLSAITPVTDRIYCLTIPDQPAALEACTLVSLASSIGLKAETSDNILSACRTANDHSETNAQPIIICGSLYLAGAVLQANGTLPD
jgi:dihydrofolate synthase/folylpolyglutamate synthase